MDTTYVKLLIDEQKKQKVSTKELCEGIYSSDMFQLVKKGKRSMDRVTAKRLLARLGVDNGNFEYYLEYPNYEAWKRRMEIISYIEDDKIEDAQKLLEEYIVYEDNSRNKSRENVEKQFYMFMQLQILKHKTKSGIPISYYNKLEEALKLTVPNIDNVPLNKLRLSPVEITLVLEYKYMKYANASLDEKLSMYEEIIDYVENVLLGTLSVTKVYSKVVTYMYKDIRSTISEGNIKNIEDVCRKMFAYCETALCRVKKRKFLYYLTEVLEMRLELLKWFELNGINPMETSEINILIEETTIQLNELVKLYKEYNVAPYMYDDCYLYRESGIYCVNDVVKTRRIMMGLTQDELCEDDVASTTLWRLENEQKSTFTSTVVKFFDKLNLFPSYINTGIVTDNKQAIEMYEEIRYAMLAGERDKVKELLKQIRGMLSNHPINSQVLLRIECLNKLRMREVSVDECIETLKQALEYTIKLTDIQNADKIFITVEELTVLYLISAMHKEEGKYDEALMYIKEIYDYCKDIEKRGVTDGNIGIYEMVMTYIASLYGDIGRYEESNAISKEQIRWRLKLRRGNKVHTCIYNIAWNNDVSSVAGYDYNSQIGRCIKLSQLLGDARDEMFYINQLK